MRIPVASVGVLAVAALASLPAAAPAQSTPPFTASLSADTTAMGELFELRIGVRVPPSTVVHFPDTLPATVNVESAAPVRIDAREADDGALLTLTYPMIAFGSGPLPVPGLDLVLAPRGDAPVTDPLPGGSAIGAWSDAPRRSGSARLVRIPRQEAWVVPVLTPRELAEGVEPMPPNDVSGGSWSWPALTLMILCSSLLAVTLVSTTRGWMEASRGDSRRAPPTLEELRERALRDLDALHAEGVPPPDRLLDFYTRSSDIVRRYVEAADRGGSASLTSSELMTRLRARFADDDAGMLPSVMGTAEVVKFGRLRPTADAAERHWHAVRDWVEASGERAW